MFNRKTAIIDLNTKEVKTEDIPVELIREEIGGASLNLHYYKRFSQFDPVVIGTGPLTGTLVPASALAILTARSPLTNSLVHIPLTWHNGVEIKYSGFDFIVITGTSPEPVYIWCHDEIVEICKADKFEKMNTEELVESLRTELGDENIQINAVGPAGRKSFSAGMISENYWGSKDTAGIGSAVGMKNILALAFRGLGTFKTSEDFVNECLNLRTGIDKTTSAEPNIIEIFKQLSTNNELINILENHLHRNNSCFNCGYNCYGYFKFREDASILKKTELHAPGTMITSPFSAKLLYETTKENFFEVYEECQLQGVEPGIFSILRENNLVSKEEVTKILNMDIGAVAPEKLILGFKKYLDEAGLIFIPFLPVSLSYLSKNVTLMEFLILLSLSLISGICPIFLVKKMKPSTQKIESLIQKSTGISNIKLEQKVINFIRENITLTRELIDKRIQNELKKFL